MNYTEKYHLPQWEETDRIMRTDFNQMCADMEAGLKQNAQTAATALSAANSKPTSAAVNQAQTTANQALSAANAAQTAANAAYSPSYQPYVTGSYTGGGPTTTKTINLGFKPTFLIISGQLETTDSNVKYAALIGAGILSKAVTLTNTGFTINAQGVTGNRAPINEESLPYSYLAFR